MDTAVYTTKTTARSKRDGLTVRNMEVSSPSKEVNDSLSTIIFLQ